MVRGNDAGDLEDFFPALHHPFPTFRRVDPAQRSSAGSAGLMEPRVAFDGIRQVCAKGRIRPLVLHKLSFRCERETRGEVRQARDVERNSERVKLAGIEFIARKKLSDKRPELFELKSLEFVSGLMRIGGHEVKGEDSRQVRKCAF